VGEDVEVGRQESVRVPGKQTLHRGSIAIRMAIEACRESRFGLNANSDAIIPSSKQSSSSPSLP